RRLDEGVDAPAVRRRHGDADLPPDAVRQALAGELLPGVAAVARDVEPAPRPAALEVPRVAAHLPEAGEDRVGVAGVEGDVRGTGVGVLLEHLLPAFAAVAGAVDAALGVGAEGVSEDGGEGDVGVARIDRHLADLPDLAPDVGPG